LERPKTLVADVGRFRGKRRLTEMALQTDQHTPSSREFRIRNLELRMGAGTTAALSRAIAAMSLSTATAVASPPAPAPKMPISPECVPRIRTAFCAPRACPKIDDRATSTGATQAVSAEAA